MRLALLLLIVCGAALAPRRAASHASAADARRPNIVVILVDDMGFSDLGCYGGEIPTPRLDALAAGGLRFSQFYNTGRCCPTRASLLTGLYPHQAGVGHMTEDSGLPGYRGRLDDSCVTIAEALRTAGYHTSIAGKWHVGQNHGVAPWNRGFGRSLNPAAGGFYMADAPRYDLSLDGEAIAADDPRLPADWYSTDLWTTFGLTFVDDALAAGKPFFLYVAHNAPHFPLQAPAAEIAKFRGRYRAGWDALHTERLARQRTLGLLDARWTPAPRPETVAAWDSIPAAEQDRLDHLMAVYAAVVHRMDKAVGDLVDGLAARGVLDDTLILFLSDNGGNAESGPRGRTDGDPTQARSQWFCGESWAYLENTPLEKYKHFNHEGGIATPLVAHWPKGIAARGEWRHQPGHVIDILPTCLDVAGGEFPQERQGKRSLPPEGRSLVPAFAGDAIEREALYWEHEGNAAVRVGDLKLVRLGEKGPWELYDLVADRTEQHDLASSRPDDVTALAARWQAWAERAHVVPRPEKKGAATKPKRRKAAANGAGGEFLLVATTPEPDRPRQPSPEPSIEWVNAPTASRPLPAGVTHRTFHSRLVDRDVGYCIFLPPGYSDSTDRYPVIYSLHGNGGDERTTVDAAAVLHEGLTAGRWPAAIMVFPNGGRSTFYKDSHDGRFPIESILVTELIPHVDATYRTVPDRTHRVIEGFSMGGRGAARLAVKYPELFCSVFCQAGNVPHLVEMFERETGRAAAHPMLGPDRGRYEADDVYLLTERNAERIRDRVAIQLACGTRDDGHLPTVRDWHAHLLDLGIDHTYIELDRLGHRRTEMLDRLRPIWFDHHVAAMRRAQAHPPRSPADTRSSP